MPPLYHSEFYATLSILPLVISLIKNPRALQLHLVRNSFLMKRWLRGKEATASCRLQVGGVCGCVYCICEHSLEKEVWISQPTAQSPSSETCSSVRSGWSTGPSLFLEQAWSLLPLLLTLCLPPRTLFFPTPSSSDIVPTNSCYPVPSFEKPSCADPPEHPVRLSSCLSLL